MPYYFRLPVITDLTIEQQAALNEPRAIAVNGSPGTGKSVVCLWRHIQNHSMQRRKSLLLTYTKSLEKYLKSSALDENKEAANHVNRTYWWTYHFGNNVYEEIIIDEAQDVEESKYNKIRNLTPMVSYSADDNQSVFINKGTSEAELRNLFQNNILYTLQENFRNTKEIVQFVKSLFPTRIINSGITQGPKPTLFTTGGDYLNQRKIVKEILRNFNSETHNIAVLFPKVTNVFYWYDKITQMGYNCSKFTSKDDEIGIIENIHITTFKSAKGLEFDTVIIPDFNEYQVNIQNNDNVSENDYYVVFTRARRNLFLIDNSKSSGKECNLPFMQSQLTRNIVEVDNSNSYSFFSESLQSESNDVDDDDLPF